MNWKRSTRCVQHQCVKCNKTICYYKDMSLLVIQLYWVLKSLNASNNDSFDVYNLTYLRQNNQVLLCSWVVWASIQDKLPALSGLGARGFGTVSAVKDVGAQLDGLVPQASIGPHATGHHCTGYVEGWGKAGWQLPSSVSLFYQFLRIFFKTLVAYSISRQYLTGVAAARLLWHQSNMNPI